MYPHSKASLRYQYNHLSPQDGKKFWKMWVETTTNVWASEMCVTLQYRSTGTGPELSVSSDVVSTLWVGQQLILQLPHYSQHACKYMTMNSEQKYQRGTHKRGGGGGGHSLTVFRYYEEALCSTHSYVTVISSAWQPEGSGSSPCVRWGHFPVTTVAASAWR